MLGLSQLCLEMVSRCPACNAPTCRDASTRATQSVALTVGEHQEEKKIIIYLYMIKCMYTYSD